MSRFRKELNKTNKRNAIIIGTGLLIVILATLYTVHRFMELLE